jgi:hypothetical protein
VSPNSEQPLDQPDPSQQTKQTMVSKSLTARFIDALTTRNFLFICIAGLVLMLITLIVPGLKDATPSQHSTYLLYQAIQQIGIALFVTSIVSIVVTRLIENTRSELQDEVTTRLNKIQESVGTGLVSIEQRTRNQAEELKSEIKGELEIVKKEIEDQTKKLVKTSDSLQAMEGTGIARLYHRRKDAIDDITYDLENVSLSSIRLIGISLNDFVQGNGVYHEIWKIIAEYALGMQQIPKPDGKLDIKVLVIDPDCQGAYLRATGEQRTSAAATVSSRLALDINFTRDSLTEIRDAVNSKGENSKVSFDFRFYQLPPILFLLQTNIASYVQPYYFWDSRDPAIPMPLFRFKEGDLHHGMTKHFDWIWQNASISSSAYIEQHLVGADRGLRERGIINVFDSSKDARERILWLIEHTHENLYIQGFSLHSYFDGDSELYWAIRKLTEQKQVKIKILLIDPESEQAKYRAWREHILQQEDLGETPLTWEDFGSGPHRETQLYSDTKRSIQWVRSITTGLTDTETFRCKSYATAPYCFMLMSDSSVLVEQYHYGKINQPVGTKILGKDMPILEYKRFDDLSDLSNDTEQSKPLQTYQLMKSHFEFVFERCADNIPLRS